MSLKKVLIIICAVLFFLAALTSYANRVIFPRLIKKVAIERIEIAINRKVEIGSIRFSWVRGFVIDKIKIYEKAPTGAVFAQADQVSFGIIFFPGLKRYRITIPYINVSAPSVHLIRTSDAIWNFSDMYTPSPPTATPVTEEKSPAFEIAWGGITINDGKALLDDVSSPNNWSEFFDNINLKLSLSYKGINYSLTTDIPDKKGFVGATVYYQPITKNTQAQIHLKNINTASYLSLINIPDMHLESGIIKEINLNISYTQDKTSAQGDVNMQNLDISSQEQNFKGDIEIRNLDAQYQNGNIKARGQMVLNNIQTRSPEFSAGGSVQTKVNDFELTKEGSSFIGSLHAQNITVNLKDRQVQVQGVILDNVRIRKDMDGIQSVGSIETRGLSIQWPKQKLQGDIALKAVTMRMKDENDIRLEGELRADNFSTSIDDKNLIGRHILLENVRLSVMNQKNIDLETKLSADDMTMSLGNGLLASGSLQTEKLYFNLEDSIIKASAILNASHGKLVLDHHKTIEADPRLELTVRMPLNDFQQLTYKGAVTLSDGHFKGFAPIQSLDNVELDADFQNDEATINALTVNILDTNVRITGSVKNFKNPFLNITADAEELNLAKIKDILPPMARQYGLTFNGTSFVKVQFEGLMADPLAAKILAVASVKNADITSSIFHQQIKNITGIVEASPDSFKWRDFTAVYLGKHYTIAGSLENLKKPAILATLNGPDLQLKADIAKNNNVITINALAGKYMNAAFNSTGTITLRENKGPVFNINTNASLLLENIIKELPYPQKKNIQSLHPTGIISMSSNLQGTSFDFKNYTLNATITSPTLSLMGYKLNDLKINFEQDEGKIKNLTFDGKLYDGTVHAVSSVDLLGRGMPYDFALNIDNTDLHKLKMDSPLKMNEIDGKVYLTTLAHGTIADFKNNIHATGSLGIRDGYLGEFNLFKGLLGILNEAMRLGQVMITDVDGNFTIEAQKINTDNLRLKGPTIVLLGKGWVNFDQACDLNVTVDLSSGAVPDIAHDMLKSLNIRIYDNIANPKFKKKISVPQVINTLLKNLLQ
ncbi:MAG: hypothetical protein HQL12_08025 [Candidatus Omnitrophica bacterium]|nr:hypothetical protein [Candidatus Omnitrophota bacterium]